MSKAGFTGSDDDLIQLILHIKRNPSGPNGELLSSLMLELLDRRIDHAALNNQAQDLAESNRRLEEAIALAKLTLSILQSLHQRTRQLKFAVARAAEAVEPQ